MSEIEQEWKENTRLDGRIEEKRSKDGFDFHFGGNLAAKSGSDKAESRTKNGVGARFEQGDRSLVFGNLTPIRSKFLIVRVY